MKESAEVDDHRNPQNNTFVPGEDVYLRTDGKCDSEWSGPHKVTKILSDVTLEINGDTIPRHITHVKKVPRRTLESSFHDEDSYSSESETESVPIPTDSPIESEGVPVSTDYPLLPLLPLKI